MYNKFGQHHGGYRSHSTNRFGGYGRSQANSNKKKSFAKHIDTSLFIKKAEAFIKIEEVTTINNFCDFKLHPQLSANILSKGFTKPTPIQDQAIPHIMTGRDVLGIANTGTGKTAAFAIPLINNILKNPNKRVIILAPTRELAAQIKQDIRSFTMGLKVYITLAIGGAYIREQIIEIRRGPHIIIGTPGRIKDLGERRVINFGGFDTVVLDEVDRMLDMGFVDDIKEIMNKIPQNRQTLFFSATVDRKIEGLINTLLNNPVKIALESHIASGHVEQNIIRAPRHEKQDTLAKLLTKSEFNKVLVFAATKRMVDTLTRFLVDKGVSVDSIHGDKPQNKRQRVIKSFKENQISVLVATDVAARGLDIADISHVINYDIPNNYEDYIHRIGRTGRGNATGYALTFVE